MTHATPADTGFQRPRELADESPGSVSRMSMGQFARKHGMTRMTLYRRAGSREAIVASLAHAGVTLRSEPSSRDEAIETTADLLREHPIGDITVDAIGEAASCPMHAIYDHFWAGRASCARRSSDTARCWRSRS